MKNKENKNIEKLVENLMAETAMEIPSVDFTAKVMSGVFAVEKKKSLVYKPLISKWAWYIILGSFACLFSFVLFKNHQNTPMESYFNFSLFNSEKFFHFFSGLEIPPIASYVFLIATVMIFIQIFFLKNYLNKRFHK